MADPNADLRQRFEEWTKDRGYSGDTHDLTRSRVSPDQYYWSSIQDLWECCQAFAQPSSADLEKLAREESLEEISAKVHEQWMESKRLQGISSRKSESGEELMVSYSQLSESAKELDRGSVRAVLSAIKSLQLLTSTLGTK